METSVKIYAICDSHDIYTGLRLARLDCRLVVNADELRTALDEIGPEVGMIIVNASLAAIGTDIIEAYKQKNKSMLFAIIYQID